MESTLVSNLLKNDKFLLLLMSPSPAFLVHENNTTVIISHEKQEVPSSNVSLKELFILSDTKSNSLLDIKGSFVTHNRNVQR